MMHLPIVGNMDLFHYVIPLANADNFDILKKGTSTFPGKALHFNEWIKHFWQKKEEPNCRFEAMLCLWLGYFIFAHLCDSKDTFSYQVIPRAMAIMRGHMVLLALLFLGLLYHELDQLHTLEEQVAGSALLKSFFCARFLQIFM